MGFLDNFFGSGKTSVSYKQGPQQAQMYNMMLPLFQRLAAAGGSGGMPFDIPSAVTPSSGWFNNLSSDVMKGIWEPYNEGANQMMETMGMNGQIGSARGGYSGTGGNAMGSYYADAASQVGKQAWDMTSPGLMNEWQARLQALMLPYGIFPGMMGETYANPIVKQGSPGLGSQLLTAATGLGSSYLMGLGMKPAKP